MWKYPALLLSGIGISYLGGWIYLIALNVSVLNMTGSPAAVAGLFMIKPIATLFTNTWSGSVIDRVNKRKLMIFVNVMRGLLVMLIPLVYEIWLIYVILFFINLLSAFFGPASSVYITRLVPANNRKRFNSLMSLCSSGAFLIGPAISGVLIMYVGTAVCIFINAAAFLICALLISLLPNVEDTAEIPRVPLRWMTIKNDWIEVKRFAVNSSYFILVFLLFQGAMLIGFALDSQEVTFIKLVLELSDRDYGLIVSITGIGAILGAFCAASWSNKIHLRSYIGYGMLLTSIGYLLFYASNSFLTATLSFVLLGYFMAFANAGYATFFQNQVPTSIMGRFASIADMLQGIVQITFTLLLGLFADWFSLQLVCIIFSAAGIVISAGLLTAVLLPSKMSYYQEHKGQAVG